jgi:hypothetical protein
VKPTQAKSLLVSSGTILLALTALLPARADYSSTVESFNPAAYWRLNETTPVPPGDVATNLGSAGAAAWGLYFNGATHGVPGAMAGSTAAQFASGAWVRVPNSAALNPNPPFSVEFWINPNPAAGVLTCPLSSTDFTPTPRLGWLFYTDDGYTGGYVNGGYYFRVYSSAGTKAVTSPAGLLMSGWTHVVGVVDGANVILYVNGQSVGSTAWSGTFTPNVIQPIGIGTRYDTGFPQDGSMDDVAIYGVALSANDVKAHYDAAITNAAGYATQILAANPVGYWRLNEPAYTPPDPSTLPVAANSGTLGAAANGTEYPGVTAKVAGPPYSGLGAGNYACQFDGLRGYVDCGNPDGLNFVGQITMMAWVKPTATDGLRNIVSHGYQTSPNNAELGLRINGGNYEVWSWGVGNSPGVYNIPVPPADIGNWVFLAGTYDGTTWHLYRDGVELGSTTDLTGAIVVSDTDWAIGARGTGTERFFQGGIDEVAVFTNGLSAAQIVQVYNAANVPPTITQQPQAPTNTVYEGMTVPFQVGVVGGLPLAYQWTKNGTNLLGKTATSLMLSQVATNDSGSYAVVITNVFGAVTSSVAALNVQFGPPVIFQQPQSISRFPGGTATFSVVAGGSVPVTFQWTNSAGVIHGATNASYSIPGVTSANAGNYGVILTNPYGTTNSAAASLTILPVTNYAAVVMAGGPLAYWRLNETSEKVAFDYAGGYDSTHVGGVTVGQPGPRPPGFPGFEAGNDAVQFDGTQTSSSSPGVSLLNNRTNFTMCGWINPSVIQQGGFFGQNDVVEFRFLNATTIELWTPYGSIDYTLNGDVTTGNWSFLAASGTATTLNLYINGQLVATTATSSASGYGSSTSPFLLSGNTSGNGDASLNGLMDEVALYTRTLSAFEIEDLYYNATTSLPVPVFTQQPQSITRYAGATAVFSPQLNGSLPMTFQWQHANTNLPGATSATLVLPNVSSASAGSYVLMVTNPVGNASSTPATLTVLTLAPGTYAESVVAAGPVAYWRLDESSGTTAYDYCGGYDGTYNNVTLGTPGALLGDPDKAATFDGLSSSVSIGNPVGLNFPGQITLTTWVRPTATDGLRDILAHGYQTSPDNAEVQLRVNGGAYETGSWDGNGHGVGVPIPYQDIGAWVHLAATYDGTAWRLYRNGLQVAAAADTTGALIVSQQGWAIGSAGDGTERFFSGDIDEPAIFNQALTPDQILALFSLGSYSTNTGPFVTSAPASQTVIVGSSVSLSATVMGSLPISYQWKKDGVNVPGATGATLSVTDIYFTDAGNYVLWATNGVGYTNTAVATLTVTAPPTFADLTNGLVLHLTFDTSSSGLYLDSSGRGNNATLVGSPTLVPGKLGQAMHYNTDQANGIFNYATLGTSADLQFGSNQNFSVSYWIRFTGPSVDLPVLCNNNCGEGCIGFFFGPAYYTSGAWAWAFANSSYVGIDADGAANSINDGQWHNVVSTFDRTGLGITYLNGVPVDARSISLFTDTLDTANPVNVGQVGTADYGVKFGADVDDLGVWLRALSPAEAESIYLAGQNSGQSFDVYGPVKVYVNQIGTNFDVSWQAGTLLQSSNVTGPYKAVSGTTAPFYRTTATGSSMFFRVQQ